MTQSVRALPVLKLDKRIGQGVRTGGESGSGIPRTSDTPARDRLPYDDADLPELRRGESCGFRFCGSCGAALAAAPARDERKVVSVLFADLVGFTSKAEQLDPEDVRATLSPYYARLRKEIERHGGTVEKFIGDAVMALFGAPVAHEDDPERAVRAALAIRDAIRELNEAEPALELQVRIAVTTGEALIALGARPSEGEGMASGDVVNTAARLQSAAPVDGVLVSEATYRATRHTIDYREAEPVTAKGKSEPIVVWEALAARSRFGLDLEQTRPLGARRPRARGRLPHGGARALPPRSRAAARHARGGARDRQEPARQRALPAGRPRRGADPGGGRAGRCPTARASATGRSARS